MLPFVALALLTIGACDLIQEEIDRAESIELEDYRVDIGNRDIYLKITSDADEQVIEDVEINGDSFNLESQGDNWYLLSEVPVAKTYDVENLYYRTDVGVRLSFDVNESITMDEALGMIPEDQRHILDELYETEGYTFTPSDEALVEIDGAEEEAIEEFSDWAWIVLEDEVPTYAIVESEGDIYILTIPENLDEYIE